MCRSGNGAGCYFGVAVAGVHFGLFSLCLLLGMLFSFFLSGSFFPSLFLVCSRCCVFVESVLPEGSIETVEMQLQLEKVYAATPFSSLTFSVFTGGIRREKAPCSRRPRLACQFFEMRWQISDQSSHQSA
jgi:hypothetical protein